MEFEIVEEGGPLVEHGGEVYLAIELLNNHSADDQANSNALGVNPSLWVADRGEDLEQLILVLLLYAVPVVLH